MGRLFSISMIENAKLIFFFLENYSVFYWHQECVILCVITQKIIVVYANQICIILSTYNVSDVLNSKYLLTAYLNSTQYNPPCNFLGFNIAPVLMFYHLISKS